MRKGYDTYSEKVILSNLDAFAARNGWMPVRHSYAQVQEFKELINKIIKVDTNSKSSYYELGVNITEKLKTEIHQFILNEVVMCSLDSAYWEKNYAFVCDEKGQIAKFSPRLSQKVYCSVIEEFDEQGVSIELLILKGRQLGITTQTALKFIHRMLFVPHTQAIMASVKTKASELIERILNTAYTKCPWWLIPRRMPKGAFANGSILSIQSGMQATGLAQGWSPTCAHLSELADIPDPKKTIEEGLFRAMHSTPNLFMVLEGTGGGNTGWLADTWRAAKSDWPNHRLRPIFISWPMCPEIYPPEGWLTKFPIENFGEPLDITKKHVARCEAYIRNTPYLSRVAGKNYRMPVEQQWFWQFNYVMAAKNHTQKTWTSQMPADDFESLIGEHDSVFDETILKELEENIYEIKTDKSGIEARERRNLPQTYAITGHDIEDSLNPSEDMIDDGKSILVIEWDSHRGQHYEWFLNPLKPMDEDSERDTFDRLIIFEEPKAGNNYSCGIDTADGLGEDDEDRSVISMTKNRYSDRFDLQVAEFTTNRLNSAQITAFAAAIGAWYSPCCPDARGVKFAIEQIQGPGDTCQHQLKMMGFNNHHDPRRYDTKKIVDRNANRQGFFSTAWSVSMLMSRFIEAVNGGWYVPQSKWLIEELRTLERHITSGKSKMEHRSGQHDDRVRAAAQSYFTAHDMDVLADRAQKRYAIPQKKADVSKGVCVTRRVGVGGWE